MNKPIIHTVFCCLLLIVWIGTAHADLDLYIEKLNVSARADLGNYKAKLGVRFEISNSQLEILFKSVETPAEVAVLLWLGEESRTPIDSVLNVYHHHKTDGWGSMAKRLGIKPGSPAFHALKRGNLNLALNHIDQNQNSNAKSKKKKKNISKQKHS
ncbi:MAG: hypothetical protein JRE16_03980 [Deltaproteobacteria bacterium]|nr:hypothetical protein [Deltaproteobacteria bacterium]